MELISNESIVKIHIKSKSWKVLNIDFVKQIWIVLGTKKQIHYE